MARKNLKKEALEYHRSGRPGKIEVIPSKSSKTARDLSLAYSPGVAEPCMEIYQDPKKAREYTTRGNLIAVISNGTAVLGLGNLGALASKPVMEGKGVLFKKFADIDVFDIEINTEDPKKFIECVKLLEPTFGGINLEDIKAPECFQIERELKEAMNIPVFHDDQHGTAIVSGAALLNAVEIQGKDISKIRVIFNGAGAASIACARLYQSLGVRKQNIIMCDSRGVIHESRQEGMNEFKREFATAENLRTLADAMKDADVFAGLSVKGAVTPEMIASMAKKPIVFAMANPDPEISYEEATKVRDDLIFATGRSDYPNQVNNVLGFPFIFRGALDVHATSINEEMKVAAVKALADLARHEVTEKVSKAYGGENFQFGPNYIIPKPFDERALLYVAPAVAKAAMDSGVAQTKIDLTEYKVALEKRLGVRQSFIRSIKDKLHVDSPGVKRLPKIVFPEGWNEKVLRACEVIIQEEIANPILLGNESRIAETIDSLGLDSVKLAQIITPRTSEKRTKYAEEFWKLRRRKGVTEEQARSLMKSEDYFGSMMVREGDADGMLGGITKAYPDTLRPFLQVVGARKGMKMAGVYMMLFKDRVLFLADATVNIDPTAEDLADIAICAAEEARFFDIEPKVAMLSFSNFGSNDHPFARKVRQAVKLVKERDPDLIVDGEMQADTAVEPRIVEENFPFCEIQGGANVLVFPNLESANTSYKLLQRIGGAEAIGPVLIGMNRPMNVLQRTADVDEIINMAMITAVEIQNFEAFGHSKKAKT